jgi:predicted DNA-binding transcriptional regulator YafY
MIERIALNHGKNNNMSLTQDRSSHVRTPLAKAMEQKAKIDYTNYRGERGERVVIPQDIWHGSTEFHPTPQWLMTAWDVEKHAMRTFALKDVHKWTDL